MPAPNGFSDKVGSGRIAKLFMMLSVLPLPPIPIRFRVDFSQVADKETKQALAVAMNSLKGQGRDLAVAHSSHNVIAALTLFSDWCQFGVTHADASKLEKDGAVLELMARVLADGGDRDECSVDETVAYQAFLATTERWIRSYLPPGADVEIQAMDPAAVGHESDVHIGMAHYCYSQGVLYSAKGSALACPVHRTIQRTYEDKVQACKTDADAIEHRELDNAEVRRQQQEMAELYSQHSFGKLLVLCFARIHRDTLHGHVGDKGGSGVQETARELLEKAQKVHSDVLREHNMKEVPDMQVVPAPAPEEMAVTLNNLTVEDAREGESNAERAVDMFVCLAARCTSGSTVEADWACLARNVEDAQQLLQVDDGGMQSACKVVDFAALHAVLKPLVSEPGVSSPGKKRIDEALLQIESGRGPVYSLAAADTMSFPSELGVLIRSVARNVEQGVKAVQAKANQLHRAAGGSEVKKAAEIFRAYGFEVSPAEPRFQVVADSGNIESSTPVENDMSGVKAKNAAMDYVPVCVAVADVPVCDADVPECDADVPECDADVAECDAGDLECNAGVLECDADVCKGEVISDTSVRDTTDDLSMTADNPVPGPTL